MFRTFILSLPLACIAFTAKGHEFWIDPVQHQVEAGGEVVAALRVGQNYKGSSYSYLPPNFRRFDFSFGDALEPVPGTIGDRPALSMAAPGEGLLVVIHVTTDLTLTYNAFEKFRAFVTHKDAVWTLDEHAAQGFPTDRFREVYSRYAKSLVAIGHGAGKDRAFGLETEIVALENPYTDDMTDGIDVQVLYRDEPRGDVQIEVFQKADDESVEVFTVRTDDGGRATVPVVPGHRYMLDSVVLRRPAPEVEEAKGALWESLWANLTFAVP